MTTAEMIRRQVQEVPAGTFIRPAELPGTRPAVLTALSRLHADGELVRVRNGLYWKGLQSRFGSGRPNLLDAAVAVAGTGAGPTGWSAAQIRTFHPTPGGARGRRGRPGTDPRRGAVPSSQQRRPP